MPNDQISKKKKSTFLEEKKKENPKAMIHETSKQLQKNKQNKSK